MAFRVTRAALMGLGRCGALAALVLASSSSSSGAQGPNVMQGTSAGGLPLRMDRVSVSVAVDAVLRASTTAGYVLCDSVLQDKRLVSLRFQPYQLSLSNVSLWLAAQGYALRDRGGVLYVCTGDDRKSGNDTGGGAAGGASRGSGLEPAPVQERYSARMDGGAPPGGSVPESSRGSPGGYGSPVGSPLAPWPAGYAGVSPAAPQLGGVFEVAAYRPDYVDPTTIAEVVRSMLPEAVVAVSVAKLDARPAVFVRGAPEVVERFRTLAHYVDTPAEKVVVSAILAEVTTGDRAGWSVSLIGSAISSKLGLTIGAAGGSLSNGGDALTFRSADFGAVLGAISTTSGARIRSTPRVAGRSGEALRLQVGDDVPILGAVVSPGIGTTANEVTYRSSGLIFEVTPQVRGKTVTLAFKQELSAFAETVTGVRGSPTLSKRELTSTVDLDDGEWLVLGGLGSSESAVARNSFLGLIPTGKLRTGRTTELVMLVNVRVIRREAPPKAEPVALPALPSVGRRN